MMDSSQSPNQNHSFYDLDPQTILPGSNGESYTTRMRVS